MVLITSLAGLAHLDGEGWKIMELKIVTYKKMEMVTVIVTLTIAMSFLKVRSCYVITF